MVTTPLNPLKIPAYLNLSNATKTLPKRNIWTFYNVEADVLYTNFHQPALVADDSELTEEGILIRYQNDEIIGLTILNISRNDAITK
jgi:uncharacterized protein YuzE